MMHRCFSEKADRWTPRVFRVLGRIPAEDGLLGYTLSSNGTVHRGSTYSVSICRQCSNSTSPKSYQVPGTSVFCRVRQVQYSIIILLSCRAVLCAPLNPFHATSTSKIQHQCAHYTLRVAVLLKLHFIRAHSRLILIFFFFTYVKLQCTGTEYVESLLENVVIYNHQPALKTVCIVSRKCVHIQSIRHKDVVPPSNRDIASREAHRLRMRRAGLRRNLFVVQREARW